MSGPVVAIVAPEPVSWLGPLARIAASIGPTRIFAPWSLRLSAVSHKVPAGVRDFLARRALPLAAVPGLEPDRDATIAAVPGWTLGEAALRVWASGRADRALRARFALRRAVDALAAPWLRRLAPSIVIAPSCAAQRGFAAARDMASTTFLLEDLPWLRELHRDLDVAARSHPGCAFLRRFRAPGLVLARQEAERVLADHLIVRSQHARGQRQAAGFPAGRIIDFDWAAPPAGAPRASRPRRRATRPRLRVLLAGLAAARHGTVEALAAIADRPEIELVVRAGEGMEPGGLLGHPRVSRGTPASWQSLDGIDAVIAPSWCEAHLPEVALAARAGLPVIATARAAGFTIPTREIPPGDPEALGRALDAIADGSVIPLAPRHAAENQAYDAVLAALRSAARASADTPVPAAANNLAAG